MVGYWCERGFGWIMRNGWQQNEHECEDFFRASANLHVLKELVLRVSDLASSLNGFRISIYEDFMFDGIIAPSRFEFSRTTGGPVSG